MEKIVDADRNGCYDSVLADDNQDGDYYAGFYQPRFSWIGGCPGSCPLSCHAGTARAYTKLREDCPESALSRMTARVAHSVA